MNPHPTAPVFPPQAGHDALIDYLAALRLRLAIWRLAASALGAAFVTAAAIRNPAGFVAVIMTLLLLALFVAGLLYNTHKGDAEIGVAGTDQNPTP
ncbi:MAG: hypothetical protein U1G08_17785 [Verrucomicrobiota bacterium]